MSKLSFCTFVTCNLQIIHIYANSMLSLGSNIILSWLSFNLTSSKLSNCFSLLTSVGLPLNSSPYLFNLFQSSIHSPTKVLLWDNFTSNAHALYIAKWKQVYRYLLSFIFNILQNHCSNFWNVPTAHEDESIFQMIYFKSILYTSQFKTLIENLLKKLFFNSRAFISCWFGKLDVVGFLMLSLLQNVCTYCNLSSKPKNV